MPGLTSSFALAIIIFVTILWGSWFQVVKHTGDYPIYAFLSWLYAFSIVIVWGSILFLQDTMVPGGVFAEIAGDWGRAGIVFVCGAMYAIGMQLQLTVVGRIGLILSTSISATSTILTGTVISAVFGGLPDGFSFPLILFAAFLLILATIVCQYSGVLRDRDKGLISKGGRTVISRKDLYTLLFACIALSPFFSVATAVGLRSDLRPDGFSSLTSMGILVLGAFTGTSVFTAVRLTKDRKWPVFLHPGKGMRVILPMALVAALCHFGGNVLHAIAAPVVSIVVAVPLGYSFSMWSYVWGLLYGEFKGATAKTYTVLASGIALFIAGAAVLSVVGT